MTTSTVNHLLYRIFAAIRYYLTRPSWLSEVGSGIATTCWGILACNISDSSDKDWPSVDLFFKISETPLWGIIAISIGMCQLGLLQLFDRGWSKPWLRWVAAIAACWLWGMITCSAVNAKPWPPGSGAYFGWWFVNVYLISRIFWTR